MRIQLPHAVHVDMRLVGSLLLLPAVTGVILAGSLLPILPASAAPEGVLAFMTGVVKLCYLGTAAAHVGRGIAEWIEGTAVGWFAEDGDAPPLHPMRRAAAESVFWARFPNAFDAALITAAVMTLIHLLS